jgi:YafQ family addiction module toxin component
MSSYEIIISPDFEKDTKTIVKKDPVLSRRLQRTIANILANPECGKPLRNVLKGRRRVHIGHFVLVYKIDDSNKTITLLRFTHQRLSN